VAQLKTYARYFQEEKHREYAAAKLGFEVCRPRLALVIGRSASIPDLEVRGAAMEVLSTVDILTYDDLLTRYRRMAQIG
jgi:hypothetical protein